MVMDNTKIRKIVEGEKDFTNSENASLKVSS